MRILLVEDDATLAAHLGAGGVLPGVSALVPDVGEFEDLAEGFDFAILAPDMRAIYHEIDSVALPKTFAPGFSYVDAARSYTAFDEISGYGVAVIETPGLRAYTVRQMLPEMLMPLLISLPILAATTIVFSRRAIAPVSKFAGEIAARDGRNLAPIAAIDTPEELDPVSNEVERLLARVRAALEAERSVSAECAHELRTPLAGALAQVQTAKGDTAPDGDVLDKVEGSLQALSNLSETLLQNSRVQVGFAVSERPIDVVQIVETVLAESHFTNLENDRFDLDYPESLQLLVRVDADACAIALRNLFINALRYSPPGALVAVSIGQDRVDVVNASPRIPADILDRLGERFVRANTSIKGTGLGLSITRSIMEDIGGSLELRSPIPGQTDGFAATLIFPAE